MITAALVFRGGISTEAFIKSYYLQADAEVVKKVKKGEKPSKKSE